MAHDHAHGHDHHHGGPAYYYEQLFTLAGCGALAVVTLLVCLTGQVRFILVQSLQPALLAGGLGLLALVVIRAVALWTSVEEPHSHPAHDHDHSHDHDQAHEHHDGCAHHHHHHDHSHEHHHDHGGGHEHHAGCDHGHEHKHETAVKPAEATAGLSLGTELLKQTAPAAAAAPAAGAAPAPADDHNHDHDHDHGWAPLRFVVLFVPVVLFLLNLPNDVFSASRGKDQSGFEDSSSSVGKREAMMLTFSQFERAALLDEETRTRDYEGKTITLVGRFAGENESQFTLIRYKMNCCAADAQPINAAMRVDYSQLPGKYAKLDYRQMQNRWVEVTGQLHFLKKGSQVMSALIVTPTEPTGPDSLASLIRVLDRAPDNPYVN
jgi:hypothetical protein